MSPRNTIENTIKQFDVDLNPDRDKEIVSRLLDAQSKTKQPFVLLRRASHTNICFLGLGIEATGTKCLFDDDRP